MNHADASSLMEGLFQKASRLLGYGRGQICAVGGAGLRSLLP